MASQTTNPVPTDQSASAVANATNGDPPVPSSPQSSSSRGRSFSFLRRSKSNEGDGNPQRSVSGSRKLTRKRTAAKEAELRRRQEAEAAANTVPRMPSYHMLPSISNPYLVDSSLGLQSQSGQQQQYYQSAQPSSPKRWGYNPNAFYQRHQTQMDRSANSPHSVPVPPIPEASPPGTALGSMDQAAPVPFDPYARTESMTNRGRMSYASSFVSQGTGGGPRRLRRRKDPTPFNILVVGAKNCGKTSFIEFLRSSLSRPVRKFATSQISPPGTANTEQHGSFTSHYLKTELEGERIGLTLYDSKGLERHLVDLQLREMAAFVESKFQETFNEETKVRRATGVTDTHIHCVLLILDPARLDTNIAASGPGASRGPNGLALGSRPRVIGGLDEDLDIDVLRTLQGKTTVIPIISKADTITTAHMSYLKRTVYESLKKIKFDPLAALSLDIDGNDAPDEADEDAYLNNTSDKDSSIFHDADDGEDDIIDELVDRDGASSSVPGKSAGDPSNPPQHDEIRVSRLSENVELPYLPMSVISPDVYDPGTVGRRFPWGFADPYNPEHCDFSRLKESVFSEWRADLRETSRERWYEGWRTSQMKRRGQGSRQYSRNTTETGSRAVSGAPSYGTQTTALNGVPSQQRSVSSGEIGVAVGTGVTPLAYREKPMNGHT